MSEMNLETIRKNIDELDRQIVRLITNRSAYVEQAAQFKNSEEAVQAPDRVEAVIQKVRTLAQEMDCNPDMIEEIYRTMIDCFIRHEMTHYTKSQAEQTGRRYY